MNKIRTLLSKMWTVLLGSVNRYPETLLISLGFVVVTIINNHLAYDPDQVLNRLAMVLALGIPISATMLMVHERLKLHKHSRLIISLVMIIYGLVFYRSMPDNLHEKFTIRYAIAMAAFIFLFTLVPYIWRRKGYSLYCIKLLVSFFVTYLYTLVLYFGVIAIIFAVDFLFELNISEKIYFDTFVTAIGVFGLTYFLGKVPEVYEEIFYYRYPGVLRVLLVSIVVPLISVYTLVLHAYLIRVLAVIGWTDGFISQLVIWYGFVSVFLMVALFPLKENSRIVQGFYKWYPFAMIIPMAMLFVSMLIRINAYGMTMLRGMVLVAWFWFVVSMLAVLVKRGPLAQLLISGFILIFILAAFAPVNVFNISDRQQTERLTDLLENAGILDEGKLVAQSALDDNSQILISDIMGYLEDSGGLSKVAYLPDDFELKDMEEVFGFGHMASRYYVDEYGQTYLQYYVHSSFVTQITGYDYHGVVTSRYGDPEAVRQEGMDMRDASLSLQLWMDGQLLDAMDIEVLLSEMESPITYQEGDQPLVYDADKAYGRLKLIFQEADGIYRDGELELNHYKVQVFVAMKE